MNQNTHYLIESDNIGFLEGEQEENHLSVFGSVDLIYIDPPYNTGNTTFTYHDKVDDEAWVEMMEESLSKGKPFLKNTGVVAVSIDDSQVHYLRCVMDKVFGKNNFIAQVVVSGRNPKNNSRLLSISHEYILIYAKSKYAMAKSKVKWRVNRDGIDILLSQFEKLKKEHGEDYSQVTKDLKSWMKTAPISDRLKTFFNADSRGLYTYSDLSVPSKTDRAYDILHPVTGKPCQVPSRGWGFSEEKMNELIEQDMVIFGKDEKHQPTKKMYLKKKKDQVANAIWSFPSRSSTHILEKLLGKKNQFNNPKNLDLMKYLVDLTVPDAGVVMDYFAGSGTTAHAVMELNKEGASRSSISVTNNENDIFYNVTRPRLDAVFGFKGMDSETFVVLSEK